MSLVIRKMTADDLNTVVEIDQLSFSLPWPAHSFGYELTQNPVSRCWVAELERRVVGMLVGWLIVDEIHIATVATHPEFRGRGIGSAVLLHALRAARDEGVTHSFLEVRAGNLAAQKMYANFGYVEDGRRKAYYKDNAEDAILMSLNDLSRLPGG